jgi:hypothetical protein
MNVRRMHHEKEVSALYLSTQDRYGMQSQGGNVQGETKQMSSYSCFYTLSTRYECH